MATALKNKPVVTLRDRNLKAVIWENESPNGNFYSVELSRTYKTENGYRDSRSFNESDLLVIANLSAKAYDRLSELKRKKAATLEQAAQ